MPLGRSGSGQIPLKLQGGDNVLIHPIAPDLGTGGIVGLKTGSEDDRADIELVYFLGIVEINCPGVTDFFTKTAGTRFLQTDTGVGIDLIFERYRLGVFDINRFTLAGCRVVFTVHFLRTFLRAGAAGDTLGHVHIAW